MTCARHAFPSLSILQARQDEHLRENRRMCATAARNSAFAWLGLTDTVLLEAISAKRPLITVDLELYSAALSKGEEGCGQLHVSPGIVNVRLNEQSRMTYNSLYYGDNLDILRRTRASPRPIR